MKTRVLRMLVVLSCMACGPALPAASDTALDGYLAGLTTWTADFTQTVQDEDIGVADPRALARGKQADAERGRLTIVRPGRFRWESAPEGAPDGVRLLVADGRQLWFFDRDLEQVTCKSLKDALPQSPAMLLAGGGDLHEAFSIESKGSYDGMQWTRVLPRDKQSDFREALFGFKGKELARLVVIDKLGQRSTLVFSGVKRNAPVEPALMQFTPPAGADVIGCQ